jgi:hypothetical protein
MKKLYISLVAVALSTVSFAQLTNLGLESWTAGSGYEDPDGWQTVNQFAGQIFITPPVTKVTTDPAEGMYSASMATRYCAICGTLGVPIDTIPGIMIQDQSINGKPISVSFKYKYAGVNGDNGGAFVELTKWDSMLADAEVIGSGFTIITSNSATWVDVTVNIDYVSATMPDSISITFFSSARAVTQDDAFPPSGINSTLTVDAISVSMPVGIVEEANEIEASVYVSNNQLVIQTEDLVGASFEVYSVTGQRMMQSVINNSTELIAIDELTSGIYLVKVISDQGTVTKKVFVK